MAEVEFVRVGWLGRTRGVRGEIWVTPDTDFPERFVKLKEIFVRHRDTWEKFEIAESSLVGGRPVLRFEDITTPEDAARLTNRELAVPKGEVMALPEGSHYYFDLIGCGVYDRESGELIGELVDIEAYPANDMYVIETPEHHRVYCAAAKPYVFDIDTAGRRIVIDREGLFDATSRD